MRINKPKSLFVFAFIALVMSGCGKSSNSAAPIPNTGIVNGQYNTGGYGGSNGSLSGVGGTTSGTYYMDSANFMSQQGPSYQCPGVEQFTSNPLVGNSIYGQVAFVGTRQNCSAQGQITVILSQTVVQQIAPYIQNGSMVVTVTGVNLGRYAGTTLYGGQVNILINGSIPYILYF
jgi:hypothetical protein